MRAALHQRIVCPSLDNQPIRRQFSDYQPIGNQYSEYQPIRNQYSDHTWHKSSCSWLNLVTRVWKTHWYLSRTPLNWRTQSQESQIMIIVAGIIVRVLSLTTHLATNTIKLTFLEISLYKPLLSVHHQISPSYDLQSPLQYVQVSDTFTIFKYKLKLS